MTLYHGWTPELSPGEKRTNEINTLTAFLDAEPDNTYWQSRLEALTKQTCTKCGGSGRIKEDYNLHTCPRCDGSGKE